MATGRGARALSGSLDWSLPAEQEKMAAAKRAAIGQQDPVEGLLHGISNADASKIDRPAIRTLRGEHSVPLPRSYPSVFAALPVPWDWLFRNVGVELRTFPSLLRPPSGRLASRAALICSGVLRSGSESLTRSRARETWRLCRFANRLSILECLQAGGRSARTFTSIG